MADAIRFLVSDVDGTLVDPDKTVTPAAVAAVDDLRAAGVGFAFVSSRPPKGLAAVAKSLGISEGDPKRPAAAAFNGGAVLNARLETLSFKALPDADARTVLAMLAAEKIDAWVFTLDEWLVTDPDGHYVAHEQHTVGFAPRVVENFDGVTGIGKIVGSTPDFDHLARVEAAMAPKLSKDARALRSQNYYLDATHAEANKGGALKTIAAHEGLTLEQMAAIGDMSNDLAMLEIAGLSIAMGNASDAVKAATDVVTASNREDGFAKAIREFVLPRAKGTP